MRGDAIFLTAAEVCGVLERLRAPLTTRQVRTLADHGIIRPAYTPHSAGDSALYGVEELALLYLWALLTRAEIPYVRRVLVVERCGDAVRQAVRRRGDAKGVSVVVDRLGGRVLPAGESPAAPVAFRVPLAMLADRAVQTAESYRRGSDVWWGHAWTAPEDVAAQLAAV